MERVVRIFNSFEEQEKADIEFWQNTDGAEKLRILEEMRAIYIQMYFPKLKQIEKVVKIKNRKKLK